MHSSLVRIQISANFGLKDAAGDVAAVPSDAHIVDMHLVFLQVTTIFGFIFATINTAMVPNYANIVDMHLV